MFLYVLSPIDDWSGWTVVDDHMATLDDRDAEIFLETFTPAKNAIEAHGWFEHDTHTYPWFIAPLPSTDGDGYCEWMVATKITNNGTTFLVSPYRLPWLGDAE
jgi:hypothetical protein